MPIVDVDRLKEQGRRFVDGFTAGQKAITLIGVVAVVLASMTFMKWASKPDYAPLYTGLSSQDAGSVTQQLDSQGIKYKLTGGGGTIMVPRPDVYKTRVDLSAKGLPSGGGDSFALLDKQGITTDQFTRNVNYQRALQGELGRTIQSIDGIGGATVTLTMPHDSVFVGAEQDKPTAAVLVKTVGTLDSGAVDAIAHLVASSIPNMSADDVTIADSNGKVLHAPGMDTNGGATEVEQKQQYESAVEAKITDMLTKSLGAGHAAVTVAADIDMSKSHTNKTTYTRPSTNGKTPGTKDVPSQQNNTSEQLNSNGAAGSNGVLGPGNNGTGTGSTSGPTNYKKDTTQQNNALDTTQITADTPPGTVKKLSVSVLLDNAKVTNPADVTGIWQPQIAAAAGIDPKRDGAIAQAVQVKTVAFDADVLKQTTAAAPAAAGGNAMFDLIKHVLTLLMIGLILFFAWRAIKKAEENRTPLRVPIDLRELESPGALALAGSGATSAAVAAPPRRAVEAPAPTLEGEITDLIERQPDEVAQTLRSWLADRRT
jgi:flagellar M-ring protein FliF